MGTMNNTHHSLHGLNTYQRAELKKLTDDGWTIDHIYRVQDDDNPWASVYLRSPNGQLWLSAFPVDKTEREAMS
jgi:hypothetical protein